MYELSLAGAKILQARSVELAMRHNVHVRVLSTFVDLPGTCVANDEFFTVKGMERLKITGIAHRHNIAKVEIETPSIDIISTLLENGVPFELLTQHEHEKAVHIAFLVEMLYAEKIESFCDELKNAGKILSASVDRNVAAISIVGTGVDAPAVQTIVKTCNDNNIPIMLLSISSLKVSFVTTQQNSELAVFVLHAAFFQLDDQVENKNSNSNTPI
jgi:aspartate kinase